MNKILLAHGGGGKLTHELVRSIFVKHLKNPTLSKLDDKAILEIGKTGLAYSTDSFTVSPLFFNGGDIGRLAVCGTVNDVAMCGAEPLYLSLAFIIEEGLEIPTLETITKSIKAAASEAKVKIVTGDTKVVEKGIADKLFVNTSGIGILRRKGISGSNARPGDKIILSGHVGDHEAAVLAGRFGMKTNIKSDVAPLNSLVSKIIPNHEIHCLRDPTRGGLATLLNEFASESKCRIEISENEIPVREGVKGVCELLGFDPLYLANEGKLVAVVAPEDADDVLNAVKRHKYGKDAEIIGTVKKGNGVVLATKTGGKRMLQMLSGTQLPRIC